jgi:adenylate kinase
VGERLAEPDARDGFLFDGFPRTVPQAEALDELLVSRDVPLDVVLELVVDHDEVVTRLTGRRTCSGCGRIFHVEYDPPSTEGVCDTCGGELQQRADDREDVVRNRLEVYREQTEPLVDFYDTRGQLVRIDAEGSVEEVTERVLATLDQVAGPRVADR